MDDNAKYKILYEKMVRIKTKTNSLIESIDYLEDALENAIVINNKTYKTKDVNSKKNTATRLKKSIKFNVIDNLRDYF